jgi:hypothetical protein
MYVYELLSLVD